MTHISTSLRLSPWKVRLNFMVGAPLASVRSPRPGPLERLIHRPCLEMLPQAWWNFIYLARYGTLQGDDLPGRAEVLQEMSYRNPRHQVVEADPPIGGLPYRNLTWNVPQSRYERFARHGRN